MNSKNILFLAGDGIGPEITTIGHQLFVSVANILGIPFDSCTGLIGWAAYDEYGDVMPQQTWNQCNHADAIVMGAVGLPSRNCEVANDMTPEIRGLLALRKQGEFGCNIRPITEL